MRSSGRRNCASAPTDGASGADPGQWRTALTAFCGEGGLDVLVNNAGVLASGPFTGTDLDVHRRMVDINVAGVVNGAAEGHRFLALLARQA